MSEINPFVTTRNPLLAQWQSSAFKIVKEEIKDNNPTISERKLIIEAHNHPIIQGVNLHATHFNEGNKIALQQDVNAYENMINALLSEHYFNESLNLLNKNETNLEKKLVEEIKTPFGFPFSDYIIDKWIQCAYIWLKQANPNNSPYIKVDNNGGFDSDFQVFEIPNNSKLVVLGDFGTGLNDSIAMLTSILRELSPDFIIHLGDIYYSGTEEECQTYVNTFNKAFELANKKVPVFSIPGNHEYYSGGYGFFNKVIKINKENGFLKYDQKASYFSLRTQDGDWQFLGMDSGLNSVKNNIAINLFKLIESRSFKFSDLNPDYGPWLEFDEAKWHRDKLENFNGETILLSHHQLFSAEEQINGESNVSYLTGTDVKRLKYLNENLLNVFSPYFSKISAWYWAHEHHMEIFKKEQLGLKKGRLIGNSGYEEWKGQEVYRETDSPFLREQSNPKLGVSSVQFNSKEYEFYNHGFAMISVNKDVGKTSYYEYPVLSPNKPLKEPFPQIMKFKFGEEILFEKVPTI